MANVTGPADGSDDGKPGRSADKTSDREGATENAASAPSVSTDRKSFDAVWVGLADEAEDAAADGKEATKRWDDDARARAIAEVGDKRDSPAPSASTSQTRIGHPGVLVARPELADPESEMDKLMRGALPSLPSDQSGMRPRVLEDDDATSVPAVTSESETPASDAAPDPDATREAVTDPEATGAKVDEPGESVKEDPAVDELPAKPALRMVPDRDEPEDAAEDQDEDTTPPAESVRRAIAQRPSDTRRDEVGLGTGTKLAIGAVAAVIVGALGWSMLGGGTPAKSGRPDLKAPPSAPIAPTGPKARPPVDKPPPHAIGQEDDDAEEDSGDDGDDPVIPEVPPRDGDPRQPPAGTPPEAAAAFLKLPVSPADRPPVGGIGASGIHVDRISVGSEYVDQDCGGKRDRFSVAAGDRVSVCVRVVHPREKEEVIVLWQKADGAARRGKMLVKPSHGYRTRAYLKLRSEYVGDWTVRILSEGEVELAQHSFTVLE
jgi:hypothetical protein